MLPIVFFFTFILIILFALFVLEKKRQVWFEERFPPISDEEFLARCTPGTNPDTALKVRSIMAKCLCIEYERIYPSSRLIEDLGAD